jgi:hypothetical protein
MAPPMTSEAVDASAAAMERMEGLRVKLEEMLHAVVPLLDAPARSATLDIRRSIHNQRPPNVEADQMTSVLDSLPEDGRRTLSEWLSHQRAYLNRVSTAEESYAREVSDHVRPALRALAAEEVFLRPLALASHSLFSCWAQDHDPTCERLEATKQERSLLLYVARAAAKCSPFSVFVHQALVPIGKPASRLPQLDPGDRDSRAYLDRGLLFQLHRQAVGDADDRTGQGLILNESISWGEQGRVDLLAPEYVTFSARILRLGRPATFRLHPALVRRLAHLPRRFSLAGLVQILLDEGMLQDTADRFSAQLCQRGLVQPEPFTHGFDPHPEEACLSAVRNLGGSTSAVIGDGLRELIGESRALAIASAARRFRILDDSRSRVARVWHVSNSATVEGPPVIFWEDGFFRRPLEPIGDGVHGLLQELATALRPHAVVTAPYGALRELFLEDFGTGGVCRDLAGFLHRASSRLAQQRWWLADPATVELPASKDSPITATVLVQFIARSEADLAAGRASVLLNQVFPGCGWLVARHAFGESEYHVELRRLLAAWLASVHSPAEPIDVLLSGDCNPLQAHPRLTERVLRWPIEPGRGPDGRELSISSVSVRHDPTSGLLNVFDSGQRPLALVYLGATVPHPAWGPEFWLTTLSWPHRVRCSTDELTPPSDPDIDFLPLPRRTLGRAILRRASWWMKSDRMSRRWFRRRGAGRLVDVAVDCDALGMPRRLFIRPPRGIRAGRGLDYKPIWVDTRNPFCLDTVSQLISQTQWLFISEALPDGSVWPTLSGEQHVSELLFEAVL